MAVFDLILPEGELGIPVMKEHSREHVPSVAQVNQMAREELERRKAGLLNQEADQAPGEQALKCPHCDMVAGSKMGLLSHVRAKHKDIL